MIYDDCPLWLRITATWSSVSERTTKAKNKTKFEDILKKVPFSKTRNVMYSIESYGEKYEGTSLQIAAFLDINRHLIYTAVKNKEMIKGWRVRKIGMLKRKTN